MGPGSMKDFFMELDKPVYILTTEFEDKKAGYVLTWINQVSLSQNPFRISFVCSKFNSTLNLLKKSKQFKIYLLSELQAEEFFIFGTKSSAQFDKSKWFSSLQNNASGLAVGNIISSFETADREVFHAELAEIEYKAYKVMKLKRALELVNPEQKDILTQKLKFDSDRDESILRGSNLSSII